jgi:hypothetical protein
MTDSAKAAACVQGTGEALHLVAIVKREYVYSPQGRLRLADELPCIVKEPVLSLDENGRPKCLEDDIDILPPKPATDVIVRGSAFAPRPLPEWPIAVAVGASARALRVLGERRAEVTGRGVRFSPPAPVESVPLRWELAYGGYDRHAHQELTPAPTAKDFVRGAPGVRKEGLFAYPRNRAGRAYFIDIDRSRADGAELPQIDDPADPLDATRFFVRKPKAWIDAPLPGGLGWMAYPWYPRGLRMVGPFLDHDEPQRPIRETTFADGVDLRSPPRKGQSLPRAIQGAVPGLAVERLRGDELVILCGLDRDTDELRFQLPGEIPNIDLRPPGTAHKFHPTPVLQTIRIDTDLRRVSVTFCGAIRLVGPMTPNQVAETSIQVKW